MHMPTSEDIYVGVSKQVLWVGSEAYPLQNIARAQTVRLVPNRAAAWRRFLTALLLEVFLGVAAAVALGLAPRIHSVQAYNAVHGVAVGVLVLAVVLVVISTIRLMVVLSRGTYYALVIETAGTPRRLLVSPNEYVVARLIQQIMKAINDPRVEFEERVKTVHYHFGDEFTQYGDHSIGKVSR
jgi:Family of unknown function (DUF6232)